MLADLIAVYVCVCVWWGDGGAGGGQKSTAGGMEWREFLSIFPGCGPAPCASFSHSKGGQSMTGRSLKTGPAAELNSYSALS